MSRRKSRRSNIRAILQPQTTSQPVTWMDALSGYIIGIGGGYGLAIAVLPIARQHTLLRLLPDYLSHFWMLAIALCWLLVARRSFPIGQLSLTALRPWGKSLFVLTVLILLLSLDQTGRMAGTPLPIAAEMICFQAVLVGLAEEFVVRGIVQTGLNRSITWTVRLGATEWRGGTLLAALLFAATHIISLLTEPPGQVVVAVVLALGSALFSTSVNLAAGF